MERSAVCRHRLRSVPVLLRTTALALFSCIGHAHGVGPKTVPEHAATLRVDTTPGHAINSFDPEWPGQLHRCAVAGGIDKVYSPHIVQESLSAGWGPISYRNNTELRMAAWHWTENGTWSDPAHKGGYFTGSSELKEPLRYILAYALPHRGFSTSGDRPSGSEPQLLEEQSLSHQQVHR